MIRERSLIGRYFQLVLRHRAAVLALSAMVTLLSGWQISRGVFGTSLIQSFLGDDAAYARYRSVRDRLESGDLMVVAFEDPKLFTPEGWDRLGRIAGAVGRLPFVRRVYSVWDAYRIRGSAKEADIRPYFEVVRESKDYEALRRDIFADAALSRTVIAADGCCAMLLLELAPYDEQPVEKMPDSLDALYDSFTDEGFDRDQIHLAGLYAETVEGISESQYSVLVIFPFTVLILLGVVYLLFHQLWPVVITTGVSLIATVWTFAVAILLDREINLLMAMVPAVTMIISFSDIVHLCGRHAHLIREGRANVDAIIESGDEVGRANLYTALTTGVGFAAMSFIPAPVFRTVSAVLCAGVTISFVLAITLVPILLASLSPKPTSERPDGATDRLLDRVIRGASFTATRHPWATIGAFALISIVSAAGAARIELETSMVDRLSSDNRLQIARTFIDRHFDGSTFLEIYVTTDDGDLLDPETYARIEELQAGIAAQEGVDSASSIVDLIDALHRAVIEDEAIRSAPKTRAMLSQYLLLAEASGTDAVERLVDEERRTIRILARLDESGMSRTAEIGRRIEELSKRTLPPTVEALPTGLTKLFGDWIDEVIEGQKKGLLASLLTTTLMMCLCFRRIRAGLVAMIPNALPVLMLGGLAGFAFETVDSDVIVIAMIATGIAVDDTIHFVTCLLSEAKRAKTVDEAIERAFQLAGRSMVKSTVILCLGFAPFALSGYSTTRHMGTLLPFTLFVAMLSDLFLTPALAKIRLLRVS